MKAIRLTADAAESFGRVFALYSEYFLLSISMFVVVTAAIAPFLGVDSILRGLYTPICHQIESRCLVLDGTSMPLCARCFGGYSAFVLAWILVVLLSIGKRNFIYVGIIAAALGTLDVILHTIGLYDTGNVFRLISGALLGGGIGIVTFGFVRSARESFESKTSSR